MKKLLSLLLVICLAIGLLPVLALADNPTTAKVMILGEHELSVTEGGTAAYLKNKEFDAAGKADGSATFKAWTQEPGDAENWNVKFEWPTGGVPTVTLKNVKMDYYDNATETYAYVKQADGTYISTENRNTQDLDNDGETANNKIASAIMPVKGCNIDLKVVLEGENFIETGCGIVFGDLAVKENNAEAAAKYWDEYYFKNLTVAGTEGSTLVANGGGIGIMCKTGYNLTLENANIEIETSVKGSNAIPIHVTKGILTINGGHLKVKNMANVAVWADGEGGNIIINGDITVENKLTSTSGVGGIYSKKGTVTVNGGNIVGMGHNCPIMSSYLGTYIKGGNLKLTSAYYALYAGAESLVQIDGGTVEITAERACNFPIFLGEKMTGVCGANIEEAEYYTDVKNGHMKPFLLLTDDATKLPSVTPTEPSTEAPTTQPPTQPTQKPTQSATTPTQSASQAPTTSNTNDGGSSLDPTLLIVAGVILVAAVAVVVIIVVRKKGAAPEEEPPKEEEQK